MKRFLKAWHGSQARGIAFALLLACLLCLAFLLALRPASPDLWLAGEQALELREGWQADGRPLAELPVTLETHGAMVLEISRVMHESGQQGNSILLRTSQQAVEVLLDGQLLYRYEGQQGAALDIGLGAVRHIVRLPEGWSGSTLTLRFVSSGEKTSASLNPVYLGTKAALLTLVARQALPGLIACFLVMAGGAALLMASLLFREGLAVARLRWLGALAVLTGLWAALETRSFQLFSGNTTLCYTLVFTSFALVPVCAMGFLLTYPDFGRSRYLRGVYWLSVANFVWVQAAQIFGWAPYLRTITGVHFMLVLAIGGILAVWLRKNHKADVKVELHLFAAFLLFAGFGMVDMLRFYMGDHSEDDVLFTRWGFLCFVGALGWQVLQQASAERAAFVEQKTLRQLAYTDALTGLANRTAFERIMEEYRTGLCEGRPMLLVADLNQLKVINDSFGHAAGDEAINHCAASLQEAFADIGQVYRIGGDEFFVLSAQAEDEAFRACVEAFEQGMAQRGARVAYELQAACGWCRPAPGESIDQAFIQADRQMYRRKAEMESGACVCGAPT